MVVRPPARAIGRRGIVPVIRVLLGLAHLLAAPAMSARAQSSGAAAGTPTSAVWDALRRRPLHLPSLRLDGTCPTSPPHKLSPPRVADSGPDGGGLLGPGPVYVGVPTPEPVTDFQPQPGVDSPPPGGTWTAQKAGWVAEVSQRGRPLLVRGHQIGGPNDLRFTIGTNDPAQAQFELRLAPQLVPDPVHPYLATASLVWARAPGCYAYQIDGPDFSEVIVFVAHCIDVSHGTPTPAPLFATRAP